MNSFIQSCKFLSFSAAVQSHKPNFHPVFLRHLQQLFFFTSSSSNCNYDEKEKEKKKNNQLPKLVIPSTSIAELLKSSCGFPPEEAKALEARLSATSVKKKKSIENARNVIEFFKDTGFSDTHIRKVISRRPKFLTSSVEKTLKPKVKAYENLSLSTPEIRDLIANNASILTSNPASIITKLSLLFESKEDVVRVIKKSRFLYSLSSVNLEPRISKYLEHGVSKEKVARSMVKWPLLILMKPKVIEENIQKAYKFGFKYGDGMLMVAVNVIASMNESTWDSKFQVLRSYGWKDDDIVLAFHKAPTFLAHSVGSIKRILTFFMEDLKYEPFDLASHSRILCSSLDKTIAPRYNVIKESESKGLLKRKKSLFTVLRLSEKQFQKDFLLDVKDEHPDLVESYLKSVGQV